MKNRKQNLEQAIIDSGCDESIAATVRKMDAELEKDGIDNVRWIVSQFGDKCIGIEFEHPMFTDPNHRIRLFLS